MIHLVARPKVRDAHPLALHDLLGPLFPGDNSGKMGIVDPEKLLRVLRLSVAHPRKVSPPRFFFGPVEAFFVFAMITFPRRMRLRFRQILGEVTC
jgi:hypothetical protein